MLLATPPASRAPPSVRCHTAGHQNYFMWGSGFSSSLLLLCLVDPRTVFVLDLFLLSGPTPATLVKLDTVLFPGLGYLETIFKGPGSLTNYFEFVLHV